MAAKWGWYSLAIFFLMVDNSEILFPRKGFSYYFILFQLYLHNRVFFSSNILLWYNSCAFFYLFVNNDAPSVAFLKDGQFLDTFDYWYMYRYFVKFFALDVFILQFFLFTYLFFTFLVHYVILLLVIAFHRRFFWWL